MHIFLQGNRGVGKSTVIRKTLEMLGERMEVSLGGFFTWNGGENDPNVYLKAARPDIGGEAHRVAYYDAAARRMICDKNVFESAGARILDESADADLILMDELGYLESDAETFKKTVMKTLAGEAPVLGVLRLGDVPWHDGIKNDKRVTIYDVNEKTRDTLPRVLSGMIFKDLNGA